MELQQLYGERTAALCLEPASLSHWSQEHDDGRWLSVGAVGLGSVEEAGFTCSGPLAPLSGAPLGGAGAIDHEATGAIKTWMTKKDTDAITTVLLGALGGKHGEETFSETT